MLQWTGGSRRKVITSRKSIQKRQKQYFEQKKRPHQTNESQCYVDGRNKCAQDPEEPRSLDILSLMNLATVVQGCRSSCTTSPQGCKSGFTSNGENAVADYGQVDSNALKHCCTNPPNNNSAEVSVDLNEENAKSTCHKEENIPTKKTSPITHPDHVPSTHKYAEDNTWDKQKKSSENELSVLDLLEHDEFPVLSEQRLVQEAHVAFSVDGLGKMCMETPCHSPRKPNSGFYSPPKAARRLHSLKNLKFITDDFNNEANRLILDFRNPFRGSKSESSFSSRVTMDQMGNLRSPELSSTGCVSPDTYEYPVADILNGERVSCSNMDDRTKQHWNDRLGFLDDGLFDERKYGLADKSQQFRMDYDSDFLSTANHGIHNYGFEDLYMLNQRSIKKSCNKFDVSESTIPYFKHLSSGKGCKFRAQDKEWYYDFMARDMERYHPTIHRSTVKQPSWSFLATEDAMDNMSLLSEESCSSDAVRNEDAKKPAPNWAKLTSGKKVHGNDLPKRSEKNVKRHHTEEMMPSKYLKGVGCYENVPNLSGSTKGMDNISLNCKLSTEDDFSSLFPIPEPYPNVISCCKRIEFDDPVDQTPSPRYFYEKDVSEPVGPSDPYGSLIFSSIKSSLINPNLALASRTEGQALYSSCALDILKGIEAADGSRKHCLSDDVHESVCSPTNSKQVLKEQQKGMSMENGELSSGNEKAADVPDFKDSCSEREEAKDDNPEPIESPKTKISYQQEEENQSTTEGNSLKHDVCINDNRCRGRDFRSR